MPTKVMVKFERDVPCELLEFEWDVSSELVEAETEDLGVMGLIRRRQHW